MNDVILFYLAGYLATVLMGTTVPVLMHTYKTRFAIGFWLDDEVEMMLAIKMGYMHTNMPILIRLEYSVKNSIFWPAKLFNYLVGAFIISDIKGVSGMDIDTSFQRSLRTYADDLFTTQSNEKLKFFKEGKI